MNTLLAELHCHTCYSHDSLMEPGRLLELCAARGIQRLAITDHNAIEGAFVAAELDPERVIVGEEIRTTQGELLGYFMREFVPPGLSPEETIARLREQRAFISVAHPFDRTRSGSWEDAALARILPLVDALEIRNGRSWSARADQRAATLALQSGLLGTAGSDAHAYLEVGRVRMRMAPFHDKEGLRAALKGAQVEGRRSSPLVHLLSRYAAWRKRLSPGN
jgi:predicted metal-dependent phosphoesterase TrpH